MNVLFLGGNVRFKYESGSLDTMTVIPWIMGIIALVWCYYQQKEIDSFKHDIKVLSNLTKRFSVSDEIVYQETAWSKKQNES